MMMDVVTFVASVWKVKNAVMMDNAQIQVLVEVVQEYVDNLLVWVPAIVIAIFSVGRSMIAAKTSAFFVWMIILLKINVILALVVLLFRAKPAGSRTRSA